MTLPRTNTKLIGIIGPTAAGKSVLAMRLAAQLKAEIVVCDSVQIYRGFDIGAVKPDSAARRQVVHHLLDSVTAHEDYSAGRYRRSARQVLADILARGRTALIVGGCGLYWRALLGYQWHDAPPADASLRAKLAQLSNAALIQQLQQLDPQRAAQVHVADRVRLLRAIEIAQVSGKARHELPRVEGETLSPHVIYLKPPREELHRRIAARTENVLNTGLVAEVKTLLASGCPPQAKPMQSIGYRQVVAYLQGKLAKKELATRIIYATRQYAKRQMTWFNKTRHDVCVADSNEEVSLP